MSISLEFLKKLQNKKTEGSPPIKYQQYELCVEDQMVIVCIPLRESEQFENTLDNTELKTKQQLKEILRNFRGFIEPKKA